MWLAHLDERIPAAPDESFLIENSYWSSFCDHYPGWKALWNGRAGEAKGLLRASLDQVGMEFHAAGYFLAAYLSDSFDPETINAYVKSNGAQPPFLLWVGALGKGDLIEARKHWGTFVLQVPHIQDYALMYGVIRPLFDQYPAYFPQEIRSTLLDNS